MWNGNEVWLLGAGGALVAAFPTLYAASFSGFYLALMLVLWLLLLRGVGIEFRHQIHHALWEDFWDVVFRSRACCSRSCSASRSATCCAACRSRRTASSAARSRCC